MTVESAIHVLSGAFFAYHKLSIDCGGDLVDETRSQLSCGLICSSLSL